MFTPGWVPAWSSGPRGSTAQGLVEQEVETVEHALPGGRTVSVGREGLRLGEALLNAKLMGLDEPPLAECACAAAMAHPDPLIRKVPSPLFPLGPRCQVPVSPGSALVPGEGRLWWCRTN